MVTAIKHSILWGLFGCVVCLVGVAAQALEVSGHVGLETRGFINSAAESRQRPHGVSLVAQPEFYFSWDDGDQSLLAVPFARVDSADGRRSHWDLRELLWQKVAEQWNLKVGIGHVFWGVTESQHLVDIINQTDGVENIDAEDKLGQPMVNLGSFTQWGSFDVFMLPGFRPRTFAGPRGRLRSIPTVSEAETYESGAEERHMDFAVRWSQVIGDWDLGVSHFYGTSREPTLRLGKSPSGNPILIPHYEIIHQTGVDVQATLSAWAWKLESIYRTGQGDDFIAATGGVEYTVGSVFGLRPDLGILLEYLFDSRGNDSTGFEDDIFAGIRLALNDVQSTRVLAGVIVDRQTGAHTINIEGSRRMGDNWTVELEARAFNDVDQGDPMFSVRRDDYVQLSVFRHF